MRAYIREARPEGGACSWGAALEGVCPQLPAAKEQSLCGVQWDLRVLVGKDAAGGRSRASGPELSFFFSRKAAVPGCPSDRPSLALVGPGHLYLSPGGRGALHTDPRLPGPSAVEEAGWGSGLGKVTQWPETACLWNWRGKGLNLDGLLWLGPLWPGGCGEAVGVDAPAPAPGVSGPRVGPGWSAEGDSHLAQVCLEHLSGAG